MTKSQSNMHIQNIRIENFKGIAEKSLEFNPRFTVMVGDNGTGKTSILEALSIGLSLCIHRFIFVDEPPHSLQRDLMPEDLRTVMPTPDNIERLDASVSGSIIFKDEIFNWISSKKNVPATVKNSDVLKHGINPKWHGQVEVPQFSFQTLTKDSEQEKLPVFAYYATKRFGEEQEPKGYHTLGSRFIAYDGCLDPLNIKEQFISWFRTYEDSILKMKKDPTLYHALTNTISSMIPGWYDIKFSWEIDDMVGKLADGSWMRLSHLSDGYRGIIGIVGDLAYRCIKLNPQLGADVIKQTEGIVLIDELDLHLHPKWQRKIVADLKRVFPRFQFICTTHSPYIVQSLKANEVISLDDNVIDQDPDSMPIELSAAFMGVESNRSSEFDEQNKIAVAYLNILEESKDKPEERARLEKLIEQSTDPVFKAKMQIEKLAKFGVK